MDFNSLNIKGAVQAGVMQKAYENTLAATASSVTISGLDGDTDTLYRLIVRHVIGATSSLIRCTINNDSTTAIYGYQQLGVYNASSVNAQRGTWDRIGLNMSSTSTTGEIGFYDLLINAKTGTVRTALLKEVDHVSGTSVGMTNYNGCVYNQTSNNITSLVIADGTNCLGVGTYILLLKQVESPTTSNAFNSVSVPKGKLTADLFETIYENTLAADAQTITISGLDGDTDIVYEFEHRTINGYAGTSNYSFRLNNDSTAGVYGRQQLYGSSTTIAGDRSTSLNQIYCAGMNSTRAQNVVDENRWLIYAKQGYTRTLINEMAEGISGTTIGTLVLRSYVWNNTNTNLTSIDLFGDQSASFKTGSFFRLKTLKRKV